MKHPNIHTWVWIHQGLHQIHVAGVLPQLSPAARGQKVEVEYVQTFIAVSWYVGVAHCSCEAIRV